MKTILSLLAAAAVLQVPVTPLRADFAADRAELTKIERELPPYIIERRMPKMSDSIRWSGTLSTRVAEAGLKLYEAYPHDPARWEVALLVLKTMRGFVVEYKPGIDEAAAAKDNAKLQSLLVRDEAGRAAWEEKMDALQAALFAAPDVPPGVLADAYRNAVYRASLRRGVTPAQRWAVMRPLLEAMEKRAVDPSRFTHALELASRAGAAADPAGYDAMLKRLSQSSIPEVSKWAVGKANVQATKTAAVEMKFTAVDGREVDLTKLRGKVVLIDFWATWCGPCKEEMPNVRRVYEAYHDKGFEVVAVSLDSEKDKQKLLDYCRANNLPWPQFFDGKGWKNEFAVKYSINAIPAMFLLDQDGKVVTTEARGEKLETEVKRLLKQ